MKNLLNKKNRKGDLSTQQIVLIIILIASFIVILLFLFRLNPGKESIQDICHDSVIKKASIIGSEATPLQCSRQYVCITQDGTCEGMTKPEIVKVKIKEEVYAELAEEMANCWWMYGEGKVDYLGEKLLQNNYCSICSQILFDDSLKKIKGFENGISKDELYDYMAKTNISSDKQISYAKYIFGTEDFTGYKQALSSDTNLKGQIPSFGKINQIGPEHEYLLVMGIENKMSKFNWVIRGVTVGVVTGVLIVAIPATAGTILPYYAVVLTSGAAGGTGIGIGGSSGLFAPEIGAIVIEGKSGNKFMAPTLQEVDSDKFKALNCEEVLTP